MISAERVHAAIAPLVEGAAAPCGWEQRIAEFLGHLAEWNQRVNLVSRGTSENALHAHVLPSLAALLVVPADREMRVLDVGSGGGFPGIPLAILRPRIRLDLVEATRKKCRFLEHCAETLDLEDTRVHWCRIEAPTSELQQRAPFDLAISRAVGDEARITEATRILLRPGGEAWVFGAPDDDPSTRTWPDAEGRIVTALRQVT